MMKFVVTAAMFTLTRASSMYDYDQRSPLGTYSSETMNAPYTQDQIYALSSNANIIAIGKPHDDDYVDTRVYEISNDGSFTQRGANISVSSDSLALSDDGTVLAIGHVSNGFVGVYKFNGTQWNQRGENIGGSSGGGDWTGTAISLSADGDILAVGSPNADTVDGNTGCVKVYKYDHVQDDWTVRGDELYLTNVTGSIMFGNSVDLSSDGSYLAVGLVGRMYDDSNGAYVFSWNGTDYIMEDGYIESTHTLNGGYMSQSYYNTRVSIDDSGSTLVVGSAQYRVEDYYGRVTVYKKISSTWTLSTMFLGETDDTDGEWFGKQVFLSNDATKMLVQSDSMLYMSNNKFTSYDLVGNDWKVSSITRSSMIGSVTPDLNHFVISMFFSPHVVMMTYETTTATTTTTTTTESVTTESTTTTTTEHVSTTEFDATTTSNEDDSDNSNPEKRRNDEIEELFLIFIIVLIVAALIACTFMLGVLHVLTKHCQCLCSWSKADTASSTKDTHLKNDQSFMDEL